MTRTLYAKDILPGTAQIHLARATLLPTRPKALHTHDFYEVFWVQNGTVRHHLPDGAETLREGDMVFLQPGQAHALQGRGEFALVVSIAVHADCIAALAKRHPGVQGHLFWASDGPTALHRGMRALAALNQAAVQMERSACDTLAAEAFLLPLCAEQTAEALPTDMPDWLAAACRAVEEPEVFREGAAGLARVTGKAHAHVSRMMRRHLGLTPSDYVNAVRMRHAARALTTDSEPVGTIAADCGIPNMSHFHKLFRATHGMTPLQYRQRFQRGLVQP